MNFENLDVWKGSTDLCVEIYRHLPTVRDYGFRDQITRSALPVPSHIAKGFESCSQKEAINFLSYGKGSCGELRTQIRVGIQIDHIDRDTRIRWLSEAQEISQMIGGLIKTKRRFSQK